MKPILITTIFSLLLLQACQPDQSELIRQKDRQIDSLKRVSANLQNLLSHQKLQGSSTSQELTEKLIRTTEERDSLEQRLANAHTLLPDTLYPFKKTGLHHCKPNPPFKGIGLVTGRHHEKGIQLLDENFQKIGEITSNNYTEPLKLTWEGKVYGERDEHRDQKIKDSSFKPWLYTHDSDYFFLYLYCLDSTNTHYKVQFGEGIIGYVEKGDAGAKHKEWQFIDPMKNHVWWSGFTFDRLKNPLRTAPSENAPVALFNPSVGTQRVLYSGLGAKMEVHGEWIKFQFDEIPTTSSRENEPFYWIRWRKGNEVLVQLGFGC